MRQAKIKRFNTLDYTGTEAINTICTNLSFLGATVSASRLPVICRVQVSHICA